MFEAIESISVGDVLAHEIGYLAKAKTCDSQIVAVAVESLEKGDAVDIANGKAIKAKLDVLNAKKHWFFLAWYTIMNNRQSGMLCYDCC